MRMLNIVVSSNDIDIIFWFYRDIKVANKQRLRKILIDNNYGTGNEENVNNHNFVI